MQPGFHDAPVHWGFAPTYAEFAVGEKLIPLIRHILGGTQRLCRSVKKPGSQRISAAPQCVVVYNLGAKGENRRESV